MKIYKTIVSALAILAAVTAAISQEQKKETPKGQIAFASNRDGKRNIYIMNSDGSNVRRLTDNNHGVDDDPAWSPDGKKIAFYSDRDAHTIYVMDADGSNVKKLVDNKSGVAVHPAWSPDGKKIAFSSDMSAGGNVDIYIIDIDGSNIKRLTNKGNCNYPTWSPDAKKIAFGSDMANIGGGYWDIYIMDADGSNLKNLTNKANDKIENSSPTWSPDGKKIAFTSARAKDGDSGFNIYIMDADGSNVKRLTDDNVLYDQPSWSPDGRKIAFTHVTRDPTNGRGYEPQIYIMNADGSNVTRITDNDHKIHNQSPAWRPVK